jgi:sulfite reductase (NADPH) hemoprotein beta-component
MLRYPTRLLITPNQDLLFTDIPDECKNDFESDLKSYGYGLRNNKPISKLRMYSGACVGRDTCRLTYTDSEKFEPELLDSLEELGWGELSESIGITGCERQCFRPSTKSIGLVGTGLDRYQLRLFGSEDGRNQGRALVNSDRTETYLRSIPRQEVANVIDSIFKHFQENRRPGESLGYFHRRIGEDGMIEFFRQCPVTAGLMENAHKVKSDLQ